MLIERSDTEVQLFFGDNQRRGYDKVADPGLDRNSLGHHLGRNLINRTTCKILKARRGFLKQKGISLSGLLCDAGQLRIFGDLDSVPPRMLMFRHAATTLSDHDPVLWLSRMSYVISLRI